jgi:hypothetical protein
MVHVSRTTSPDRRRRLLTSSCFDQTRRCLVVELDKAGADYRAVADVVDDAPAERLACWWPTLQAVLAGGRPRETRKGIRGHWPADKPRPSPATLYRWLERAVTCGLIVRDGNGVRCKPYRYGLKQAAHG